MKTQQRDVAPPNPMADPSRMTEMLKGNLTNVLPKIVIGGWINWHFPGFVTTKGCRYVFGFPFPSECFPEMTSAKFSGFLTPSPLRLSAF